MDPFSIIVGAITLAGGVRKTLSVVKAVRTVPKSIQSLIQDVTDLEIALQHADAYVQQTEDSVECCSSQNVEQHRIQNMVKRATTALQEINELLDCLAKLPSTVESAEPICSPGTQLIDFGETAESYTATTSLKSEGRPLRPPDTNNQRQIKKFSLRKPRWMQRASVVTRLKQLQDEIKSIRANIMLIISIGQSWQTEAVDRNLQHHAQSMADSFATQHLMQYGVLEMVGQQGALLLRVKDELDDCLERMNMRRGFSSLAIIEELSEDEEELVPDQQLQLQMIESDSAESASDTEEWFDTKDLADLSVEQDPASISVIADLQETTQPSALIFSSRHKRHSSGGSLANRYCSWGCNCICHKRHSTATAQSLTAAIGSLSVEVILPERLSGPCNQHACRKRSPPMTQMEYKFPPWLLMAMVSATVVFQSLYDCKITLRAARVVPDTALVFRYATEGDLEGVRRLFAKGLASAYDVDDTNGTSALVYATDRGHVEVWRYLLEQGADPCMDSKAKHSPMDVACTKLLTASVKILDGQPFVDTSRSTYHVALTEDFDVENYLEQRQFPVLHKVVLQIIDADLTTQLKLSTADIDDLDYQGRTALAWAAIRGDESSLRILLDHGADPNLTAFNGDVPLHYAVRAVNSKCVQPLLDRGADVNAQNAWKVNSLCYAAANRDDTAYILPLLNANAAIDLCDKHGRSALVRAINLNRPNIVKCLLQHGASLPECDIWGCQPLVTAIEKRFSTVARVLLQWSSTFFNQTSISSVLEIARRYGDDEMVRLLSNVQASM